MWHFGAGAEAGAGGLAVSRTLPFARTFAAMDTAICTAMYALLLLSSLGTSLARAQPVPLKLPIRAAVDALGNVYIAEAAARRIARFDADGDLLGRFGGPGDAPGEFTQITDLAVDASGRVLVLDRPAHAVHRFSALGEFIDKLQLRPAHLAPVFNALAVDATGRLWVADDDGLLSAYDASGGFIASRPLGGASGRDTPGRLTFDGRQRLYVVDRANHRIQRFNTDGPPTDPLVFSGWIGACSGGPKCEVLAEDAAGTGGRRGPGRTLSWCLNPADCGHPVAGVGLGRFSALTHVSAAPSGELVASDLNAPGLQKFDANGRYTGLLALRGHGVGRTGSADPTAIGPDGSIYTLQPFIGRVTKFSASGGFVTVFGGGIDISSTGAPVSRFPSPQGGMPQ